MQNDYGTVGEKAVHTLFFFSFPDQSSYKMVLISIFFLSDTSYLIDHPTLGTISPNVLCCSFTFSLLKPKRFINKIQKKEINSDMP